MERETQRLEREKEKFLERQARLDLVVYCCIVKLAYVLLVPVYFSASLR